MNKQSPQDLLNKLSIPKYLNDEVVSSMPTMEYKGKIELFTIGKYVTNKELMEEYRNQGLEPALPMDFLREYEKEQPKDFIATVWDFRDTSISYAAFCRWRGKRSVCVNRRDGGWGGLWWFAGVRKSLELNNSQLKNSDALSLELAINLVKEAGYQVSKIL